MNIQYFTNTLWEQKFNEKCHISVNIWATILSKMDCSSSYLACRKVLQAFYNTNNASVNWCMYETIRLLSYVCVFFFTSAAMDVSTPSLAHLSAMP